MSTISWQEFERDPAGCLSRVEAGEAMLVTRDSLAIVELRPVAGPPNAPRPFGLAAGQFVTPSDFDSPLTDAVLQEFEKP
jgi:antitoxin (DNA-binding transcriptional repressor) of toxin-antitoxin stability system